MRKFELFEICEIKGFFYCFFVGDKQTSVGTYPQNYGKAGITHLVIGTEPFPYSGRVVSWSYYLGKANGSLFAGIWRQVTNSSFRLLDKIQLPTYNSGYNNHVLANPMQFQIVDFYSVHSKTGVKEKTGLSFCGGKRQPPACNCGVSTRYLNRHLKDEELPLNRTVTMANFVVKTIAIMANIKP